MTYMKDTASIRPGEDLDWTTLETYLQAAMPDLSGPMEVEQFFGGHANLTYLLRFEDRELVLRRPPFGKIAPGAHDMKREYRVLSKLNPFFPAAPKAFHFCADESIIGANFVIMERRKGIVARYRVPKEFQDLDNVEYRMTDALMRTEAAFHTVDVAEADLLDLGKPAGFVERQLAGAEKRWSLVETDPTPAMYKALEILGKDIPKAQAIALVHNDIKFDNCQFQPNNPDEITTMLDWDMCTIGDPLVDFGVSLSYWPDNHLKGIELPVVLHGNFPEKDVLIELYAKYSGYDLSRINWYQGLAYCKLAVILQQLYGRYLSGATKDKRMANLGEAAKAFAFVALQYAKTQ